MMPSLMHFSCSWMHQMEYIHLKRTWYSHQETLNQAEGLWVMDQLWEHVGIMVHHLPQRQKKTLISTNCDWETFFSLWAWCGWDNNDITSISRHLGYTYWAVRKPSRYPARKKTTSSVSRVFPYPARISRTLQPVVDRVLLTYPYASPSLSSTPSFNRTVLCWGSQYTVAAAVASEKTGKWKNLSWKNVYVDLVKSLPSAINLIM